MKRGEVVLVRERGTPAGKARPCVVIQRDTTLDRASKVTVVPLTSSLAGETTVRPLVAPDRTNGLLALSQAEVDWIFTTKVTNVGRTIGKLDEAIMTAIGLALRRWLDL